MKITRIILLSLLCVLCSGLAYGADTIPSLSAMQAVVDPLVASEPKLGKVDAKNFISDRFLKKLEEEGFVQKLMGR